MKKKLLALLLTLLAMCCALFFVGCGDNQNNNTNTNQENTQTGGDTQTGETSGDQTGSGGGEQNPDDNTQNGDNNNTQTPDNENSPSASEETIATLKYELSSDETYYICTGMEENSGTKVVIPDTYESKSVKVIKKSAFYDCDSLTSVTIGENVESIGEDTFEDCYKLVEVINKSSLNITAGSSSNGYVGYYAIQVLTEEPATSNFITSGDYKFYNDNGTYYLLGYTGTATDITLPENINGNNYAINQRAFYNNDKITSVVISSGVTGIGYFAFGGCSKLTRVDYNGDINSWAMIEFGSYFANPLYYAKHLYINGEEVTEVVLDTATRVSACAFYYATSITKVTIGNQVQSIGSGAFEGCSSLTRVDYNGDINSWAMIEFGNYYANPLCYANHLYINGVDYYATSEITLDTATKIGSYAFCDFDNLTKITIGNQVQSIGEGAFYWCSSLTSITIGDNVTSIGYDAFYDCDSLTSVTIGENVESIGEDAFEDCYKLVEVINKSSLNITAGSSSNGRVGYYAKQVITDESQSKIITSGDYKFYNDNGTYYLVNYTGTATDITLPEKINGDNYSINQYAFYNNDKITSVVIPSGVTSIGSCTFFGCDSLTSITIPNSVTSIGYYAFYNCSSLTRVDYNGDINSWAMIVFGGYYANPLYYAKHLSINGEDYYATSEITLDTATKIGSYAFYGFGNLTKITIGNQVQSIGYYAFYNCYKLVEVINKSSLNITVGSSSNGYVGLYAKQVISDESQSKIIISGDYKFYNDNGTYYLIEYIGTATEITLPENINGNSYSIYQYAFYNNDKITSVVISSWVTGIGEDAFGDCSKLTRVDYNGDINSWAMIEFGNYDANPLYYAKHLYINGEEVTEVVLDTATKVSDYAFYNCSSLTSVTIGEKVESIGVYAFYWCSSLTSITIGDNVTSIGSSAFYNGSSLTNVTFEDTSTWYYTSTGAHNFTGGTQIDVTNASTNATYLKSTYYNKYWYKV